MFTLGPKVKEEIKINKLSKKIEKKEKGLEILSKSAKQKLVEREEIIKKKKELEEKKDSEETKIQEEKKEPTAEGFIKELVEM